jgi:hypothetical protein
MNGAAPITSVGRFCPLGPAASTTPLGNLNVGYIVFFCESVGGGFVAGYTALVVNFGASIKTVIGRHNEYQTIAVDRGRDAPGSYS